MQTVQSGNLNTGLENKYMDYWYMKIASLFDHSINLTPALGIFELIMAVFAIFFLFVISYTVVRIFEVREKEKKHLEHEIEEYAHHQREKAKKIRESEDGSRNPRWRQVLSYVFSETSSDWKLAIIEADSMLEDLIDQLGFKGESLGEKLKAIDREKFRNLTVAWEVHAIRNRIAHEGSQFELSSHEAKRVVALYEQIFREFGFI